MAESLTERDERARKTLSLIFQRLSSVGQARLAEQLSLSEASVSRWKSEQAEVCAKALAALGLKVVPEEMRCYHPKKIDAILVLAKAHLEGMNGAESLAWDE
jgi:DNA-binding transcriptional regulator YdaS (Cro superfamily)